MFENSDAVSFATNGTATYHYPNPDPSTIGPFGSGATLKTDGEKIIGRVEAPAFRIGGFYRDSAGRICRLADESARAGHALCIVVDDDGKDVIKAGPRSLRDGMDPSEIPAANGRLRHLLPGDLVQRDGQWVAMEEAKPKQELRGAAALMEWLGKYMPSAQKHARSFACMTDFRVYMASVTGVTQEYFDSHDDACTAYLEALMRKQPASMTPTLDKLEAQAAPNAQMLVNDRRQPTARERSVMARINLAKSLAADWEAAKKQPALAHPYPFARNFQG